MYGWTITKADPSNQEFIGVSGGKLTKDFILAFLPSSIMMAMESLMSCN